MGKRKSEDSEEQIMRKIRKLESEMRRKSRRRRRRHVISSSSSDDTHSDPDAAMRSDESVAASHNSTANAAAFPPPPPPLPSDETPPEPELDSEILELLGDAPKTDTAFGEKVHKDVAMRWQELLASGLSKENKEKILQEYLIPENCDLFAPPLLNPEVKAALPDSLSKRDAVLYDKQKQIGVALAALAKATDMIIKKETHTSILKCVSDACRILCDTHFNETKTRRNFVISATNATLKETLLETKRDKYLFGTDMSDKLKSAKTVQKSGADLKPKNPKLNKSNFYKSKQSLNTRAPIRRTAAAGNKPDAGNRRARPQAAAAPRAHAARHPPARPRSPPRTRSQTHRRA